MGTVNIEPSSSGKHQPRMKSCEGLKCLILHYGQPKVAKYLLCDTIISQTAWHFASENGRKISDDDHNKANDWIFNLNEICVITVMLHVNIKQIE